MKQDAEILSGPFWHAAYTQLAKHYDEVDEKIKEWKARSLEDGHDIDKLREIITYLEKKYEDLQSEYVTRLKAVGMKDQDIQEFDEHWKHLEFEAHWQEVLERIDRRN